MSACAILAKLFHLSVFAVFSFSSFHVCAEETEGWEEGSQLVRFRNLSKRRMSLWWMTPFKNEERRFFGTLEPKGGMVSFTTYVGHHFRWASADYPTVDISTERITHDRVFYWFSDSSTTETEMRSALSETQFLKGFYRKNKYHWLSPMGRPPPVLPILNDSVIDVHLDEGFFICDPWKKKTKKISKNKGSTNRLLNRHWENERKNKNGEDKNELSREQIDECTEEETRELAVVNLREEKPKMFEVKEFVSEFEARHIVSLSRPLMRVATVGDGANARVDATRTCHSAWIAMNCTRIVEAIYRRVGAALQIDGSYMSAEAATGCGQMGVASHMEVVHFGSGGHYGAHYDNTPTHTPHLHLATVQIALSVSDDLRGGDTLFRDARFEHTALGAVIWYNLETDGNLDRHSMYETELVTTGDLWLAHVSIWDPHLPPAGDPRMPHDQVYNWSHDEL